MTNITPVISSLLVNIHSSVPIHRHVHSPDRLDTFLQEAYRIVRPIPNATLCRDPYPIHALLTCFLLAPHIECAHLLPPPLPPPDPTTLPLHRFRSTSTPSSRSHQQQPRRERCLSTTNPPDRPPTRRNRHPNLHPPPRPQQQHLLPDGGREPPQLHRGRLARTPLW